MIYHNAVKLSGWRVDADFRWSVVAGGGGVGFSFQEVMVVVAAFDDAGAGAVAAGRVGALEDLGDGLSGRAVQAGGKGRLGGDRTSHLPHWWLYENGTTESQESGLYCTVATAFRLA
jgi:hypothetical protein